MTSDTSSYTLIKIKRKKNMMANLMRGFIVLNNDHINKLFTIVRLSTLYPIKFIFALKFEWNAESWRIEELRKEECG